MTCRGSVVQVHLSSPANRFRRGGFLLILFYSPIRLRKHLTFLTRGTDRVRSAETDAVRHAADKKTCGIYDEIIYCLCSTVSDIFSYRRLCHNEYYKTDRRKQPVGAFFALRVRQLRLQNFAAAAAADNLFHYLQRKMQKLRHTDSLVPSCA